MFCRHFALSVMAVLAVAFVSTGAQSASVTTVTGDPVVETFTFPDVFPGTGLLQITTVDQTTTTSGITEVNVIGAGGGLFAFPDLPSSPGPAEEQDAIDAAFAFLGLPLSTPIASTALSPLGETTVTNQLVDLVTSSDSIVLGDLNDIFSLIVAQGSVEVTFTNLIDISRPFRLDVTLADTVTPVPLPAALPLFGGALAVMGLLGWRRKLTAA